MTVPNFLDKLTNKKTPPITSYLALYISDERVHAAVWHAQNSVTEITSLGTPVEWDGDVATTNELISAVDATISSATEGLESDPDAIVFGLASNWVDPAGIKPSKKDLLKNICRELSLKAIGYVVSTDTIVKYLRMQEGAPPSSLLIQLDRKTVTVSLVELGTIKCSIIVNNTSHVADSVSEAITKFPQGITLPSRFIVVSAMENTSDIVQELTSFDFQEKFDFLHTPKIESLPKDVEVHATAIAGGTEIAQSLGFSPEPPAPHDSTPLDPNPLNPPQTPEPALDPNPPADTPTLTSAASLGFGPRVARAPQKSSEPTPTEPEDVAESESAEELEPSPVSSHTIKLPKLKIPTISLPPLKLPRFSFAAPRTMFVIGIPIILLIGIALLLYLVPKATITLFVQAKPLTETVNLTLDPTASTTDLTTHTLPVSYQTKTTNSTDSISVTGNKKIGDPARGTVTIFNRTSSTKTFAKGTTLTANNLKFTLDTEVTVASKSAGVDYVDVPGKASVKLTANDFGDAGNLKPGAEFTIASFSKDTYVAKNEAALSGGNSRDITVFSETDKKALLKSLTESLLTRLNEEQKLDQTASTQSLILPGTAKIVSENYSAKIGEETTQATLDLTLEVGVLTYSANDVASLVKDNINSAIPSGFSPAQIPPEIILDNLTSTASAKTFAADAQVTVYVMPSVDSSNLARLISGKTLSKASSILSSLPNVVNTNIVNTPPRLTFLPLNSAHIAFRLEPAK